MRVLCVQVDSSLNAVVVTLRRGVAGVSGVWTGAAGWHGSGRVWQVGARELSPVLRKAAEELGCGFRVPVVLVLPPEACSVAVVEVPRTARRRALEAAAAGEAMRTSEALGERLVWCWGLLPGGRIAVYMVRAQVLLAVHEAAVAARFRRVAVCAAQQAVAAAVSAWGQGAGGCVVIDSLGDSWCVYHVRGAVLGLERVSWQDQHMLPAVVRRVATVHGGVEVVGITGRGADGGLAVALRSALGVGVELLSCPGMAHDVVIPGSASAVLVRSGLFPWSPPALPAFPLPGRIPGEKSARTSLSVAAAALAGSLAFGGYWEVRERDTRRLLSEARRRRAAVAAQAAAARTELSDLVRRQEKLEEARRGREWVEVMRAVQFSIPAGVQLRALSVSPGRVLLSGTARSFGEVSEVRGRLLRQGGILSVTLQSVREASGGWVEFSISAVWSGGSGAEGERPPRQGEDGRPVSRRRVLQVP